MICVNCKKRKSVLNKKWCESCFMTPSLILSLYHQGLSPQKISKQTGDSVTAIYNLLNNLGIRKKRPIFRDCKGKLICYCINCGIRYFDIPNIHCSEHCKTEWETKLRLSKMGIDMSND